MSKLPISSPTMNGNRANGNIISSADNHTRPSTSSQYDFPPPYSPSSQHTPASPDSNHEQVVPSYNPACVGDAVEPSAPSLYPVIPQLLPSQPLPPQQLSPQPLNSETVSFPTPQPYMHQNQQAFYHPHSNTPLYGNAAHDFPHNHYGTMNNSNNISPSPGGFHTIYIPSRQIPQPQPQPQPHFPHHHHHHHRPQTYLLAGSQHHHHQIHHHDDEVVGSERRFPLGALLFVFGWMCPPLWILGACCCSSSRNPYEVWWARLNLIMALLLLFSSILYSTFAIVIGDWYIGPLQWISFRQEI